MISSYTFAKQLTELKQLKEILESIGFKVEVLERSNDLPIHLLAAELKDIKNNNQVIQNISCCFLPIDDKELERIQLLQIYSGFPILVDNKIIDNVNKLISVINTKTSLGYFGVNSVGQVYQRSVFVKDQFTPFNKQGFIEMIVLFLHGQNTFVDFIFDLNSGYTDLDFALSKLEEL